MMTYIKKLIESRTREIYYKNLLSVRNLRIESLEETVRELEAENKELERVNYSLHESITACNIVLDEAAKDYAELRYELDKGSRANFSLILVTIVIYVLSIAAYLAWGK